MTLFWCGSLFFFVYLALVLGNYLTHAPAAVGLTNQKLSPCPDSPNCVCSQDESPTHQIEPIPCSGSEKEVLKRLSDILNQQRGCGIVKQEGNYLHAEFRSLFLRFVDDVEFLIDTSQNKIHIRSASRVGHTDLGANRKRVEAIRKYYLDSNN